MKSIPGALLLALAAMHAAAAPLPAGGSGLFGSLEIASDDLRALPQWTRVLERMEQERPFISECDRDASACRNINMTVWRAKMGELARKDRKLQIWEVNRFVNAWRHETDMQAYGAADYWATPLEFLERGGDSEDFAIMKFAMLRELGMEQEQLRLVMVRDVLRNRDSVVLAILVGDERFILDGTTNTIRRDSAVRYYVPYYSMNETTRWAHIPGEQTPLP